jgi:hypothetical protein
MRQCKQPTKCLFVKIYDCEQESIEITCQHDLEYQIRVLFALHVRQHRKQILSFLPTDKSEQIIAGILEFFQLFEERPFQ